MTSSDLQLLDRRVRLSSRDPNALRAALSCFEEQPWIRGRPAPIVDLAIEVDLAFPSTTGSPSLRIEIEPTSEDAFLFEHPSSPEALARDLLQWTIERATRHQLFHAAGVSCGGAGVLMPGPSLAGKSTLCLALAKHGFEILSDEIVPVSFREMELVGFPRALYLRREGLESVGYSIGKSAYRNDAGAFVLRAVDLALRRAIRSHASLIVVPRYDGTASTRLEPMPPGAAAMALLDSSCSLPRFKARGIDFAIELACRLPCFSLRYSDTSEAISLVRRALEDAEKDSRRSPLSDAVQWNGIPVKTHLEEDRPAVKSGIMRREVNGEFFVYDPKEDSVALLNGSAAVVLELCDGTRSVTDIARDVANLYGKNARDVLDDVRAALADLVRSGLVRGLCETALPDSAIAQRY